MREKTERERIKTNSAEIPGPPVMDRKEPESAFKRQIGGNHYKGFEIQPFEFFYTNKLPFHKADIIKRIMRYDLPGGKGYQDLQKIKHEIDMLIELMRKEDPGAE